MIWIPFLKCLYRHIFNAAAWVLVLFSESRIYHYKCQICHCWWTSRIFAFDRFFFCRHHSCSDDHILQLSSHSCLYCRSLYSSATMIGILLLVLPIEMQSLIPSAVCFCVFVLPKLSVLSQHLCIVSVQAVFDKPSDRPVLSKFSLHRLFMSNYLLFYHHLFPSM